MHLNHKLSTLSCYRQCLPLCRHGQWRYRGSGELASRRGSPVSREAAFPQGWQSCDVDSSEPLRLRHFPYPRLCAAEEDIATYPLSTAHHTLTENTPYRSNRREGHCCASITHSQTSLHVCPTSPITQPSTINPKTGKIASLRIKKEGAFSLTHLLQYEKFIYDSFLPSESNWRTPFRGFCGTRKRAS